MFLKVYLRTLLNIVFKNNYIAGMFVKLCNKKQNMPDNYLKKKFNLPIKEKERSIIFFQSFTGDILDCNN